MGSTYQEFTLINAIDEALAERGYIKKSEIRTTTVNFLIDTGATNVFITEAAQEKLGLNEVRGKLVTIAGGRKVLCRTLGPVRVTLGKRDYMTQAYLMSGQNEAIMGVIGLESLGLVVDPVSKTLLKLRIGEGGFVREVFED
jgi:clan AA aspartic protease